MFTVRPARPDDLPAIVAMIRELAEYERAADQVEATPELLGEALFGPAPVASALVAEPAGEGARELAEPPGELGGFALWYVSFSTWRCRPGIYLEDLYVRPAYRGGGLGRALLAELARTAVARGYPRLEWWVLDWNEPALRFYRSLGAVPMDEWTVWRLDGAALAALGGAGPDEAAG